MKTTLLLAILVTSVVLVVAKTSQTSESSKERSLTSVMVNVDESSRALSTLKNSLHSQELLFKGRGDANIGYGLAIMTMIAMIISGALSTLAVFLVSLRREDSLSRSFISLNTSSLVEGLNEIMEKVYTALEKNMDRKYN